MIDTARLETRQLQNRLAALDSQKAALEQSENYSNNYKADQFARMAVERAALIDSTFSDINQSIQIIVDKAKKKAAPTPVDYAQRTYEATAAAQDIAALSIDQLPGIYRDAVNSGNLARAAELKRLITPKVAGSETDPAWDETVRGLETPAETELRRTLRAESLVSGNLPGIRLMLQSGDPVSLDSIFNSMEKKVESFQ